MSVKKLIPHILDFVHPKSVVEVGCGAGALLEEFQQEGARIQGIDEAEYAEADFWKENKNYFQPVKLETVRINCQSKFDLAVCLECAHKYPEDRGESLVHDLCLMSDVVLFSSAIPGQGEDVVNGQMPSYWEKVFQRNGFMMLDCIRPKIWNDTEIGVEYRQNVFITIREEAVALYPALYKFYMSSRGGQLLKDSVHPEHWNRTVKKMEMVPISVKRKPRVAIICKMNAWEDLFGFIDTDEIEICACFGEWKHVPEPLRVNLKGIFYPIEEFFTKIGELEPEYYITGCSYNDMMGFYFPKMHEIGISNDRIVNLEMYLGLSRYIGIMYYYQWKWLLKRKPRLDFVITGSSWSKLGLDLDTMKPYRGIKLSTNSQTLYYQYKMAEAYLSKCTTSDSMPRFMLMDISVLAIHTVLKDCDHYFNEIFYFPIIGHDEGEYTDSPRELIYRKLLTRKSVNWLGNKVRNIKRFSENDRDGQCAAMDFNGTATWSEEQKQGVVNYNYHRLNIHDENIIAYNRNIMIKYISLCEKYHIIPVCIRFPFSKTLERVCPMEYEQKYQEFIGSFGNRIRFIDLWGLNFPDEYTTDFQHLNSKGAKVATETLKARLVQMGI